MTLCFPPLLLMMSLAHRLVFGSTITYFSINSRDNQVLTGALLVLIPLESEGGAARHVEGCSRTAIGSADVTCQICRSDIGNRTVVLWG